MIDGAAQNRPCGCGCHYRNGAAITDVWALVVIMIVVVVVVVVVIVQRPPMVGRRRKGSKSERFDSYDNKRRKKTQNKVRKESKWKRGKEWGPSCHYASSTPLDTPRCGA
jgi:hypothetical protein